MGLRQEVELLRAGFDSVATCVLITDINGHIVLSNTRTEQLFLEVAEESPAQHLASLINAPELYQHIMTTVFAGEPVNFQLFDQEFQPDALNPVWMANFFPIEAAVGAQLYQIVTIVDFRVQGQQIRKRRQAESEFRAIFENAFHFMALLKPDSSIVQANRIALNILEIPATSEIVGLKFSEAPWFTQEDSTLINQALEQAARGETFRGLVSAHTLSGKLIYIDSVFYGIANAQHEIEYILAEGIDVTARQAMEEERTRLQAQVQHTQKLESLGVLAGGIAHDFNNLLMGVLGHADLAILKLPPGSPAQNNLHEIESTARKAADLCRQMLAYSGKGKFVIEPIDLNQVITEMEHLLQVSISKSAVLKYRLHEPLPLMEGDSSQIGQIILNLVMNASDAIGPRSGIISLSTGAMYCDQNYFETNQFNQNNEHGTYLYLEISDTGSGMDAATIERIFDPFFTTKFTGRGLGLAAVLGIVNSHQGSIKVYSEPGKGTTFKLLFPISSVNIPTPLAHPSSDLGDVWQGEGTVLLVDDEETVLAVGREMLMLCGFRVMVARDGQVAVDLYRQHRNEIVCVILDLTMPRMDGEVAFRELRRINSDIKIIMSSGYNEQEVTQNFVGKGLAAFIQKPYQLAELRTKLQTLFSNPE